MLIQLMLLQLLMPILLIEKVLLLLLFSYFSASLSFSFYVYLRQVYLNFITFSSHHLLYILTGSVNPSVLYLTVRL